MTDLGRAQRGSYVANVAENLAQQHRRQRINTYVVWAVALGGVIAAVVGVTGSPMAAVLAVLMLPFGLLLVVLNRVQARRLRNRPLPIGFAPPPRGPLDTNRGAWTVIIGGAVVFLPLIAFTLVAGHPDLVVGATTGLACMFVATLGAGAVALTSDEDPMSLLNARLDEDPQARANLAAIGRGWNAAPRTIPFV